MSSIQHAMERAYGTFVKEHQAVPSSCITLIQFDDHNPQEVVYTAQPIRSAERLRLQPRGNTPLFDALCQAIDQTGERLASMSDRDRPDQVLMLVITDGQENASTRYTREDVRKRILHQQHQYQWQFVYLGANQDVYRESASLGIPWGRAIHYHPSFVGAATTATAANTVAYTSRRLKQVRDYNDGQRAASDTGATPTTT